MSSKKMIKKTEKLCDDVTTKRKVPVRKGRIANRVIEENGNAAEEPEDDVITLDDILMGNEGIEQTSETSTFLKTREDIVKRLLEKLSYYAKLDVVTSFFIKDAETLFSEKTSFFLIPPLSSEFREHDLKYRRQVHCAYMVERLECLIKTLGEKCLTEELQDPHFGTTWNFGYSEICFIHFLMFISFSYLAEKSTSFFLRDNMLSNVNEIAFFDCCDSSVWIHRLESFRHYLTYEYELLHSYSKFTGVSVSTSTRYIADVRVMLILFNILEMKHYHVRHNFNKLKNSRQVRRTSRPPSYPLCMYDVGKFLYDTLLNLSDRKVFKPNKLVNFKIEAGVHYMLMSEFSNCLMLKMAIALGVRFASINHSSKPELSLKVNDVSIVMTGPMSFKLTVLVKVFKNGDHPSRFVIYSDGSTFDVTVMMVIYLANRNMFLLPLSDCIKQNNFELKSTEELLFPNTVRSYVLNPLVVSKASSVKLVKWCHRNLCIPPSFFSASSTRKYSNIIQASPYSTNAKVFNMILSRSGWSSNICWAYGKSPIIHTSTLRKMFIHYYCKIFYKHTNKVYKNYYNFFTKIMVILE